MKMGPDDIAISALRTDFWCIRELDGREGLGLICLPLRKNGADRIWPDGVYRPQCVSTQVIWFRQGRLRVLEPPGHAA